MINVPTSDISFEIIEKALNNFIEKDKYEISERHINTYLIRDKSLPERECFEIGLSDRIEGGELIFIADSKHPCIYIDLTKAECNILRCLFDKLDDKSKSNLKDHYLNLLKDE